MNKPVYKEQGLEFVLKRTTPKNRKEVETYFEKYGEGMVEKIRRLRMISKGKEISLDGLDGFPDEYETYFDLFKILTVGPHDKLDFEDFDVKVAEQALADFLPSAKRTVIERVGSLPSSQDLKIPEMKTM